MFNARNKDGFINARTKDGYTPLMDACKNNDIAMVNLLINNFKDQININLLNLR